MSTEPTPSGLSRRSMIKRSAVVGGTLVWATPVVQTIASNQFALAGSGGTPTGGPCLGAGVPSGVYLVLRCGTEGSYTYNRAKIADGGVPDCGSQAPDSPQDPKKNQLDHCITLINNELSAGGYKTSGGDVLTWVNAQNGGGHSCVSVSTDTTSGVLKVFIPAGCTVIAWSMHDGSCSAKNCYSSYKYGPTSTNLPGGVTYCFPKPSSSGDCTTV